MVDVQVFAAHFLRGIGYPVAGAVQSAINANRAEVEAIKDDAGEPDEAVIGLDRDDVNLADFHRVEGYTCDPSRQATKTRRVNPA